MFILSRHFLPALLSVLIITGTLWSGCAPHGAQSPVDPCDQIDCSGTGTCVQDDDGNPRCDCDTGYHALDLQCILDDAAPVFVSTPVAFATEGALYSYPVQCTDANGDELVLVLSEDDTCGGQLEDQGDGTGTYTFAATDGSAGTTCVLSITCADSSGLEALQTLVIAITVANSLPQITNLPAQVETHWGHGGSFQALATDADLPDDTLDWSIADSDCAFDSTVDASGLVQWICGDVETCGIYLRITDSGLPPGSDTQTLMISCTNTAPLVTSTAPDTVTEGMHYTYPVLCLDPDGDGVTVTVDSATDTCGGTITGNSYSFVAQEGTGGTSCFVGIICTDGESTDTQTASVSVGEFSGSLPIRIIAGNLSSGNYQNYDPGHGIRILTALLPDIVLVQEMTYMSKTVANYQDFSRAIVGTSYYALDSTGFQLPNGVISRWPILASGYWDDPSLSNRELFWAQIDLPGPVDLFVISVHLHTSPAADQVAAAQVIVNEVNLHKLANPGKFYYVVGGDFNGTTTVSASGFGLDSTFDITTPFPVDDNGNKFTNAPRSSHYDFILTDAAMSAYQVPVIFHSNLGSVERTYTDGLVFDTRTFTQVLLDEYFPPALTTDSAAEGMQHMAVVKDFLLQ
ncbi:hypothetical protein KKF84_18890 [Myxococcota bacterium]|nr:hypothetical protein [Myxococcota bacterium]